MGSTFPTSRSLHYKLMASISYDVILHLVISYANGIKSDNPKYSIKTAIGYEDYEYGLLAGVAFTALFAIMGIVMVRALSIFFLGNCEWSRQPKSSFVHLLCVLESFHIPQLLRRLSDIIVHIQSWSWCFWKCLQPCSIQFDSWLFPPIRENHSQLSLFSWYLHWRSSKFNQYPDHQWSWVWTKYLTYRWKVCFLIAGIIGMGVGVLCFFFILEPKRGRFDIKKAD